MTRRRPVPLVLAVLVLVLAGVAASGCGKSEQDKYVDDYKPLNDRLLRVGESIGTASLGAGSQGNATISRRFAKLATDLQDVNEGIKTLDTPGDLEDESKALTGSITAVVGDLQAISVAARKGDKDAAAAGATDLTADARKVNTAQNKLARATGADTGER